MLSAVNYLSVFVYGLLIVFFLLDIKLNKKNLIAISSFSILCLIVQFTIFSVWGGQFLQKAYPLVVHLPLVIFCCIFFKKRLDRVLFVLCTAYILTTPRRWIGDLIALPFNNGQSISTISQIIVTIPLLFIIYKFLRPTVIKLLAYSGIKIRLLVIIPVIYYVIAYLTTVYTQLLYTSKVVAIGILTTGLALVFYYLLLSYFNELAKQFEMQTEQDILAVQISALQSRTETIKQAEENAMIHRHDLRHHLNLIHGYLLAENISDAQHYIAEIEKNIDDAMPERYCDNNAVNSILSSYINKAKAEGIAVTSQVYIPQPCEIADMSLCIIFANAIENAINACVSIQDRKDRSINISCKAKGDKLFILVTNSFAGEVTFRNELPVTAEDHHGFGTKSIAATVQKHKGICSFTAEEGFFSMKAIL